MSLKAINKQTKTEGLLVVGFCSAENRASRDGRSLTQKAFFLDLSFN